MKRALADVDPNLVMNGVQSYSEVIQADFAQQNMIASLTWLFGAVGLMLAAVGLYGVTAYGVEQRTSEIGVRMALGANRGSVVVMVLRGAFWQVGIGLTLGVPAAIGVGHLIASRLFGVTPWDPLMLSGATLLLGLAALLSVLRARAASRTCRSHGCVALRIVTPVEGASGALPGSGLTFVTREWEMLEDLSRSLCPCSVCSPR